MFDLPLHPKLVHLPIALSLVTPLLAAGILLAWSRGWLPRRSWAVVVLLQLLLAGGGWLALKTGESEEERVEPVVAEAALSAHEEAAEGFVWAATALLLVAALPLLPRRAGLAQGLAALAIVGSVVVLGLAYRTGRAGGELVYRHGAATAWLDAGAAARATSPSLTLGTPRDDDD